MGIYSGEMLKGQVALVTGASRGIGYAIASAMAECGADIAIADYCPEEVSGRAAEELAEKTGHEDQRAFQPRRAHCPRIHP